MKNKVVLMLILGMILFNFTGCGSEVQNADQDVEATENVEQNITDEENLEVEEELPVSLYFMEHLDPVKNKDGTYSFLGYFTGSTPSGSLDIKGINGRGLSMGNIGHPVLNSIYIRNSGEYGTVAADVLYDFYEINGILFEFVFDEDGELVALNQAE